MGVCKDPLLCKRRVLLGRDACCLKGFKTGGHGDKENHNNGCVSVSQAVACAADIKSIMPRVCCRKTASYKALKDGWLASLQTSQPPDLQRTVKITIQRSLLRV